MDLLLLDEDFEVCAIIEDYYSLEWKRRYWDAGTFRLDMSPEKLAEAKVARYVYHCGNDETAIINRLYFGQNGDGSRSLVLQGRMLEILLDDRVIEATELLDGTLESSLTALVKKYAMTGERALPRLECEAAHGFDDPLKLQITGKSLMSALYGLLKTYGLSYRIKYDYGSGKLKFGLWQGLDRTQGQLLNPRAVFSSDFENVRSSSYVRDDSDFKNFAYVAGAGEGEARKVVTVDLIQPGEGRHELYIDARDLRQTVYSLSGEVSVISDETYSEMLYRRGLEKLSGRVKAEGAYGNIAVEGNLKYGEDYDLGDVVSYIDPAVGVSAELRISGIDETFRNGTFSLKARFGEGAESG